MNLKVENLTYKYPNSKSNILENLHLECEERTIFLTGVNGSGKTTFMNLLNLMDVQSEGIIVYDNIIHSKKTKYKERYKLRKTINMVNQFSDKQIFNLTVKEELIFNNPRNKDELDLEIKEYFKKFNLDIHLLDEIPFHLSGGQKRKVAIITILLLKPRLLLLDEPTIGLDSESKDIIMKELDMYAQKDNNTVIVISHNPDDIHQYAKAVIEFSQGSVQKYNNEEYYYKLYQLGKKELLPSYLKPLVKMNLTKKNLLKLSNKEEVLTFLKEVK